MFFFNPRIISSSGGRYGGNADLNVAELKAIMENLIIHDRPQKTQAAVWATDLDRTLKKTDASTQTEVGKTALVAFMAAVAAFNADRADDELLPFTVRFASSYFL
ncbi:hypothetical protein PHYSODRAFT_336180 [Plasmopara halstedii]|uniref:Uncharacterized protein n=1 Tax=Plasmopara halstedii TaxID=4781 RepID=A0A0N7L468_PLAHL|nr:hypothetical protein PHYSODRAFT_336180 [Plasmopara halstedii]CEG37835.1 hypothetical protein PHYSODRAFT_336180 [Plasmopara halstedii]|eukprot:XP_024574204.1 hypothetical protein PHYSODRAFT_336180 [Plasmopara halstedii]